MKIVTSKKRDISLVVIMLIWIAVMLFTVIYTVTTTVGATERKLPVYSVEADERKVALTFEMPVTEQTFKGINHRNLKLSGRTVYMTIFGDIDKETQKLKELGATITDSTRLTLEEVFIEETEAESENEKIKSLFKK